MEYLLQLRFWILVLEGGVNSEVESPINNRAAFYDSLPLTDTHGHPVDEHSADHHGEDEDHH